LRLFYSRNFLFYPEVFSAQMCYNFEELFDMLEEKKIHQTRSWVGYTLTIVFLLLLGVFVWRVVFYSQQIKQGQLQSSDVLFSKTVSTISSLANQPVPEGIVDVAISNRPTLGNADAPLTIVEFADFGCPYSRTSSSVMRALAATYPDKIRFIYRDFPLTELHAYAETASEAAACAGDQDAFWGYHDKLYQFQDSLTETSFEMIANQLNLDLPKFQVCLTSHKYASQIAEDFKAGLAAGVRGTPTFFLNGNRIAGAIPQNILEQVVQNVSERP